MSGKRIEFKVWKKKSQHNPKAFFVPPQSVYLRADGLLYEGGSLVTKRTHRLVRGRTVEGKRFFEGDILFLYGVFLGVVIFRKDRFLVYDSSTKYIHGNLSMFAGLSEIVGNVFENPEKVILKRYGETNA